MKQESTLSKASDLKIAQMETALSKFQNYLKKGGHRVTEERNDVLREIYLADGHFNADDLFILLKHKGKNISRATVYNTLEHLVKSKLVMQNSFGHKHQLYEKVSETTHHDHLICQQCGEVYEFNDEMIEKKKKEICEKLGFDMDANSLQIFGNCFQKNCEHKNNHS